MRTKAITKPDIKEDVPGEKHDSGPKGKNSHYTPPDVNVAARELMVKGYSLQKIQEITGLPEPTLLRIHAWFSSSKGKEWLEKHHPELKILKKVGIGNGGETQPPAQPSAAKSLGDPSGQGAGAAAVQLPAVADTGYRVTDDPTLVSEGRGQDGGLELEERSHTIESGSSAKRSITSLTPKTLLWFDWSKSNGFTGDLATWLEQCIDGYFRAQGKKIMIYSEGKDVPSLRAM